jgi:hypothetical protein
MVCILDRQSTSPMATTDNSDWGVFKLCSSAVGVNAGLWIATVALCVSLFFPSVSTAHEMPPGAGRDHRGCQGSAGYIWSAVRTSCIRLFEAGLAFTPDPPPAGSSILLAYVVLAPSTGGPILRAEVFVPGEDSPISLQVVHHQEGDTRPTLLVNKVKKVRVFRAKDDHILEFKGLRYRRSSPLDDPLFQLR